MDSTRQGIVRAVERNVALSSPSSPNFVYYTLLDVNSKIRSLVNKMGSGDLIDLYQIRIETKGIATQLAKVNKELDILIGYDAVTGERLK